MISMEHILKMVINSIKLSYKLPATAEYEEHERTKSHAPIYPHLFLYNFLFYTTFEPVFTTI